jgi:hypothetical protein
MQNAWSGLPHTSLGSDRWVSSNSWLMISRRKWRNSQVKTCSSATSSTMSLMWNYLGLSPGLWHQKPAHDCLSYGMAYVLSTVTTVLPHNWVPSFNKNKSTAKCNDIIWKACNIIKFKPSQFMIWEMSNIKLLKLNLYSKLSWGYLNKVGLLTAMLDYQHEDLQVLFSHCLLTTAASHSVYN